MKNDLLKNIVQLDEKIWKDYPLPFHYISNNYYDISIEVLKDEFKISIIKKLLTVPYEKNPNDNDMLFQSWWEDIVAWGIIDNGKLIAAIETSIEKWNNRLRVTELWVDDNYRRMGIATALMNIAVNRAKEENLRAVVLETQSCNEGAISFYLTYGFSLIGFDTCAYHNNDLNRCEVRMELGILLN